MNSKTLKYYTPKIKKPKLAPTTTFQPSALKSLTLLPDPEIPIDETIQNAIPPNKEGGSSN